MREDRRPICWWLRGWRLAWSAEAEHPVAPRWQPPARMKDAPHLEQPEPGDWLSERASGPAPSTLASVVRVPARVVVRIGRAPPSSLCPLAHQHSTQHTPNRNTTAQQGLQLDPPSAQPPTLPSTSPASLTHPPRSNHVGLHSDRPAPRPVRGATPSSESPASPAAAAAPYVSTAALVSSFPSWWRCLSWGLGRSAHRCVAPAQFRHTSH